MTTTTASRRAVGTDRYRQIMQVEPTRRKSALSTMCEIDQQFAELWERPGLTVVERRWITICACAALGTLGPLRRHVYGALKSGDISIAEMIEGIYHFALYRGTPLAEEWESTMWNVADELGLDADAIVAQEIDLEERHWDSEDERCRVGGEIFERVMKFPPPPSTSDVYSRHGVLACVFAELWSRGVLSQKVRRLITLVGVCTSAMSMPISCHVQAAMQTGDLTFEETQEFMLHLAFYAGWPTVSECNVAMLSAHAALLARLQDDTE